MSKASLVCAILVLTITVVYADPVSINDPLTGYTGENADGSPNPLGSTENAATVAQLLANGSVSSGTWVTV